MGGRWSWALLISIVLQSFGCGDDGHDLLIDLRTDLRPGLEFGVVNTELTDASGDASTHTQLVSRDDDGLAGIRVADLSGLPAGLTRFTVTLLDFSGARLASRTTSLTLDRATAVTVVITSNCTDVACPGMGDQPTDTECLDARCVPEECTLESRDACRGETCAADTDCVSAIACADAVCRDGWCIRMPDDTRCREGEFCQAVRGCTPVPSTADGGVDAGPCAEGDPCDTGNVCEEGRIDCTSGTPTCVPVGPHAAGTSCRTSAGECDVEETCDGTSLVCPADALAPVGAPCSAGFCDGSGSCSDTCTPGEACTSTSPCELGAIACRSGVPSCGGTGEPAPAGTPCRPVADICDAEEVCDGSSTSCPADRYRGASVACRAPAGPCDREERCPGDGPACPADAFESGGASCRMAVGVCDSAEACTGSSPSCPTDALVRSGTECRAAAGACDLAESCDGTSVVCPTDRVAGSSMVCRGAAGACDVAESCDGSGRSCPANGFATSGTACPDDGNACTMDVCDGAGACTHPASLVLPTDALVFLDPAVSVPSGWTCMSCGAADPFWQRFPVGDASYGGTGGTSSHTHSVTTAATATSPDIVRLIGGGTRQGDASSTAHTHATAMDTTASANHLPPYRDLRVIRPTTPTSRLPLGAIVMLDTTTLPSGDFSRFTAMDGRFVRGGNTAATGGAAMHTDSATVSLPNVGAAWLTNRDNNNCRAAHLTHRHDLVVMQAESNEPAHAEVVFARVDRDTDVPLGIVAMFRVAPGSGWQVLSGSGGLLGGDFMKGAAVADFGPHGANTHGLAGPQTSQGPTVTQGFRGQPSCDVMGPERSSDTHTHVATTTLSTVDHRPPYIEVIVAKLMSCP